MTERKWTPGPWVIRKGKIKKDGSQRLHIDGKFWSGMASAWGRVTDGLSGGDSEVGWANANLIAAAPELYEACEAVFDAADMTGKEQYAALKLVVAAMAKARGEK